MFTEVEKLITKAKEENEILLAIILEDALRQYATQKEADSRNDVIEYDVDEKPPEE